MLDVLRTLFTAIRKCYLTPRLLQIKTFPSQNRNFFNFFFSTLHLDFESVMAVKFTDEKFSILKQIKRRVNQVLK